MNEEQYNEERLKQGIKEQLFAATVIPKELTGNNNIDALRDRGEEALKYYNYLIDR